MVPTLPNRGGQKLLLSCWKAALDVRSGALSAFEVWWRCLCGAVSLSVFDLLSQDRAVSVCPDYSCLYESPGC